MVTAAIYLLAAAVLGLLASLLRLPPLVGFLAAGFALGVSPVPVLAEVEILADLGVAVLLFTIGLKLDPRTLVRVQVAGTAVIALVALTALGTAAVGGLLLAGLRVDELSSSGVVVLGLALSFSSTVVVVKLLEERDDTGSLYARIAIGVLVLQDLVAVAFLTLASGAAPSPWALGLVALWPLSRLLRLALDHIDHGEMRVLLGVAAALLPGYVLFDLVGLKGDLGALVMGALLASHPAAKELSAALWSLKELLLVGFFLSIGLAAPPTAQALALAACLLLLMPVRSLIYVVTARALGVRRRSSVLAGLALTAYSEFALIVVSVAVDRSLLGRGWVAAVSLALALSFVVSALVNHRPAALVQRASRLLPHRSASRARGRSSTTELTGARTVIFGMGRVGRAAYDRLDAERRPGLLGIDNDADKVVALASHGYRVLEADATDQELWDRLDAAGATTAVLAMPEAEANLHALEWLNRSSFQGRVLAVSRWDDEAAAMSRLGVDVVLNIDDGVGRALAEAVISAPAVRGRGPRASASRRTTAVSGDPEEPEPMARRAV